MTAAELGIGIDVGSQGTRVVAITAEGVTLASSERRWPLARDPAGAHEQDPEHWWNAVLVCLSEVAAVLPRAPAAIAVTATSGTVVLSDGDLRPLRPAMMWDDKRSVRAAQVCNEVGAVLCAKLGYRFRPTFSLPKMLWLRRNEPEIWDRVRYAGHATDWLTSRLTGTTPVCDHTNALKSGYDLLDECWPDFLADLGIDRHLLPAVRPAGTVLGRISPEVAAQTGLAIGTRVAVGMTDASCAQVASGAFDLGQWVSTIGTGLSIKGVTRDMIKDPRGALYCHRHPDGYWIPSGTSHSGADAIAVRFRDTELDDLTCRAEPLAPASALMFPLPRKGEFFPIWAPDAVGFTVGTIADDAALFRACLEGIGYMERLSYEVISGLGAMVQGPVTTVGGGSRSEFWRQIRADILGRPIRTVTAPATAVGAAVVALSSWHGGIAAVARQAVSPVGEVEPRARLHAHYSESYARFLAELRSRGYWNGPDPAGPQ